MGTTDGISKVDWDQVQEIAEKITYASSLGGNSKLLAKRLLVYLDTLKQKYGRLPSIVATEADYVDEPELELRLLKEAYATAIEIRDYKNIAYISNSLAEFYIDTNKNTQHAKFWTRIFEKSLQDYTDSYLNSSLCGLKAELDKK